MVLDLALGLLLLGTDYAERASVPLDPSLPNRVLKNALEDEGMLLAMRMLSS